MLQVCYAKELKEGFVEYTEQVVKLMVPLLKFYFHDDILSDWWWEGPASVLSLKAPAAASL